MATTTLRKILDLKVWQNAAPAPVAQAASLFLTESYGPDQYAYYFTATDSVYAYSPYEDAWILLPSPALGTFSTGTTAKWHPQGPSGTALAGSTSTTLNTNITILGDLTARNGLNFRVRITGGTGAGQERLIASSTAGTNGIITITSPWSVTPDNTSTFILYTGRVYVFGAGTLASSSFKYWDYLTQTWSGNLSVSGLPSSFGTDGVLVAPNSVIVSSSATFTGTATSGTATTLVNSTKTWATNQFANWQVRITAGTGAGGIRSISSNNATTLTIASGTAIDNTSQYVIEPSDNFLYLFGNGALALYRYSISGNSWSTLTPTTARAANPGAALSAIWVSGVTDSSWNNESSVINGNRIYSSRGGTGTIVFDYYDIGQNAWTNAIGYAPQRESAASGSSYVYDNENYIYIQLPTPTVASLGTVVRWLRFDPRNLRLEPWAIDSFPPTGSTTLGNKAWIAQYNDGSGQTLKFIYYMLPTSPYVRRCLIW